MAKDIERDLRGHVQAGMSVCVVCARKTAVAAPFPVFKRNRRANFRQRMLILPLWGLQVISGWIAEKNSWFKLPRNAPVCSVSILSERQRK